MDTIDIDKMTNEEIDEFFNKRKFDSLIFLGNGDESEKMVSILLDRIKYGMSVSSGMQRIPIDSEDYKEDQEDLKNVCIDVLASFGFSDNGLTWEKLPYPGILNYITSTRFIKKNGTEKKNI